MKGIISNFSQRFGRLADRGRRALSTSTIAVQGCGVVDQGLTGRTTVLPVFVEGFARRCSEERLRQLVRCSVYPGRVLAPWPPSFLCLSPGATGLIDVLLRVTRDTGIAIL